MTIQELERVALTTDLPKYGLKKGDVGTVVLAHRPHKGYEVEFMSLRGDTLAVATVFAHQIRPVSAREIANAREVEAVA